MTVKLRATALALLVAACAVLQPSPEQVRMAEWMRRTEQLRELSFRESPASRWVSREELREIVAEELEAEYDLEYVADYRDAYAALGFFPPDLDLLEILLDLLQDQLVGLYSVGRRTLYVVEGLEQDGSMIVVHELVHVLQHQNFRDTLEMLRGLRGNDDLELAVASAVEGDASLSMLAHDPNGRLARDAGHARWFQSQLLEELAGPGRVPGVPRLLRVSQTFPYAFGTPFVARAYARAGNAGLDAQLREPPLSTLQVRFPDATHPVEFLRLPLEGIATALAPRGCRLGHGNVVGSVGLAVLFEADAADAELEDLLRAWSGDRFVHLSCPGGGEFAWLVRWKTPASAREFARRYRALAPALARSAPLAGTPQVLENGRSALIFTPGLSEQAQALIEESEVRAYKSFGAWHADGCFPQGCPAP